MPVAALDWRIKEDVPTNMKAVKAAATNRSLGTKTTLVSNLSIGNTVVNTIPIKKSVRSMYVTKFAVDVGGDRDTKQH